MAAVRYSKKFLCRNYVSKHQHAYQTRKSTETVLHNVVTCKDIALGAFLDIEGAFDRTSNRLLESMAQSLQYAGGSVLC
jgi:hypothetical protein